ncbi:MAG: ImmA/IrrE family metallo-endopeptidase [Hyphomicrobiaceae bacterium]|nr:MAG: ImmA/IrrE family metallo-endopeptidase [Hyphomicrobiaceae bacterium]
MAREQLPVTPALITWARERAGFGLEEAQLKFRNIVDWEQGDAGPTYAQLEAMSDAFKVPIAVFFFPAPPDVPRPEETFRTMPDAVLAALEPRIKLLLRKAKVLQLNLSELNGGRNPARRLITRDLRFPLNVSLGRMAAAVRDYLGVTLDQQTSWASTDVALERWRAAFARAGVFVFKDQFRAERFAGFCLTDSEFPIIYINNTATKARQIFTLFHELAHLLFHTSGVDFSREEDAPRWRHEAARIEVLCNRLAGTLLVPDAALIMQLAGRDFTFDVASELARHFHVSSLVIHRKLLDRRLIDVAAYRAAHDRAEAEREEGGGGNFYNNQMAYLGRAYIEMALKAYHQHRIDEIQLADYLLVKPRNVGPLEERFLRGVAA